MKNRISKHYCGNSRNFISLLNFVHLRKTGRFFSRILRLYFFKFLAIISAVSFICPNSYALEEVEKSVNIGIILNVSAFTTGSPKNFFVSDASNKKLKFTNETIKVSNSEKGVYIDKQFLLLPLKIESSDDVIFADSKSYKGHLIVKKAGNKINVINVLSIEDYIKGVLPKEVGHNWNTEALKVQAVISRTYTVANLHRHSAQGFDMCSATHCQVYGGADAEAASCSKAILETQGEVLTYEGKFAQAVFHANCGGHTENPKYVWNWKYTPSYLKGVKCGYCASAPYTDWESVLNESFIRGKILGGNIGKIKSIKIKGTTDAGAAKELKIVHSKGKLVLNAYQFRLAVDAWRIKSHTFDFIKTDGDKFYFKGKGWGHKVGLCQWGAKEMAEKGKTYRQILQYFYPGTTIEKVAYK